MEQSKRALQVGPKILNTLKLETAQSQVAKQQTQKHSVSLTYKDYMVKEESLKSGKTNIQNASLNNSQISKTQKNFNSTKDSKASKNLTQKKVKKTSVKNEQKRKRSTSASQTRRATSQEIKKEIQTVFNNFMHRLQNGKVEDDDSLLQESQEEPDKEAKQIIMKNQKVKRKQERDAQKEKEIREEQQRLDNLAALDRRFKSQMTDFKKSYELMRRQKEKEEILKQKKIDEIVKLHQGNHKTTEVKPSFVPVSSEKQQQQLTELRTWIEQQMQNENMFSLNSVPSEYKIEENAAKENQQMFDNSAVKLVSIEVPVNTKQKTNKKTPNQVQTKSKDRSAKSKKSETQTQQKQPGKINSKDHPLKALQQDLPGNKILSDEEKAKLPASRKNRYGVFPDSTGNTEFDRAVEKQRQRIQQSQGQKNQTSSQEDQKKVHSDVLTSTNSKDEMSSLDEPIKDGNNQSDDSCDQIPVRQSSKQPFQQRREMINKPVVESEQLAHFRLPGILNIKNQAEIDSQKQKEREIKAAITIQKRVRGHFGRKNAVKQREKISRQIEEEYGKFEREVKRSKDYDLKRYLKEKKSLREKTGLQTSESIDEISDMSKQSNVASKVIKPIQSSINFSNLFSSKKAIDKDPLSLIAVYARKHNVISDIQQVSKIRNRSSVKEKRKVTDSKHQSRTQGTSDSVIEEDYPQDFEDSVPKSNSGSTIEEDIQNSISSVSRGSVKKEKLKNIVMVKGLVPAVGAVGQPAKVQSKISSSRRRNVKESPIESIADEIIDEVSNLKNEEDSSIQEDSILIESGLTDSKKKNSDSIEEDSIIKEEYDNDSQAIQDAKRKIEARNRVRFGLSAINTDERPQELVKQEKVILRMGEEREHMALQRQRLLGDLLCEMKEYEKAHISTMMVERMEKVVVSSLAQKDQLIMAQRLAELEREKRHQEEINKIREEQIHMMSQMMLLGIGQGNNTNLSEKQRQEVIDNIKKIVEKPVKIKQETVHVNYSIQKVDPISEISLQDEIQSSIGRRAQTQSKKMTYLEEFDQSKMKRKVSESIEEEIAVRSNDFQNSSKPTKEVQEDEILDEVSPSVQDEHQSIAEDIEGSRQSSNSLSHSQSGIFRNNAFQEFKSEKLKNFTGNDAQNMHQILTQIELAIVREKDQRESDLRSKFQKRKITNKTYEKKVLELEKWVNSERREVQDRKHHIEIGLKDFKNLLNGINSERQALVDKIGLSPSRSRQQNLQLQVGQMEEDSRDSDELREAIRQSRKLKLGLTGNDPEQKYLEKKRQAASDLIEEKEKAIKKGLMSKIASLEEENADELMKKALDLDIQDEINRRFKIAKQMIEDSGNLQESSRSNFTASQDKASKQKKNVQFAPNVHVSKHGQENNRIQLQDDESISESIQIAESISNSIRSQSVAESKSKNNNQLISASAATGSGILKSEISSEYSEDFVESLDNSSRNTKLSTVSKLQAKAKDLEESNAYSEKFEEESIGQSQSAPQRNAELLNSAKKMESVKEESIDESIEVMSKDTPAHQQDQITEKSVVSIIDSLPSSDIEVKDSGKSTDWQIQVKGTERSHHTKSTSQPEDTYTEDVFESDIEESQTKSKQKDIENESDEDLNKREEIDELQSCPDEIDNSQSENTLIQKADAIADEMLKILLENYKLDNKFDLSVRTKQPDEDDFKNKFPWTLDKEPEPKAKPVLNTEPAIIKRPESPKKIKSEKEIADEKFKQEIEKNQKLLDERHEENRKYIEFLVKRVDLLKLIDALNNPIVQDPLKVLKQIQAYEDDDSAIFQNDDSDTKVQSQQILPYNFFCKVDREYIIMLRMQRQKLTASQAEESDQLTVSQEENENIGNIHHYALFEALNDALDFERPYRTKGKPMPWSTNNRTFKKITSQEHAKKILLKAKERVLAQDKTGAGTNHAPLPTAPVQTQDEHGEEIIPPLLSQGEEERRNMHRHQKLAQLMTEDIQENEGQWIDYEIQDTQTRFDLADMILHQLTGEIVSFLQEKQNY